MADKLLADGAIDQARELIDATTKKARIGPTCIWTEKLSLSPAQFRKALQG